ncbi:hypothetical protein C8N46_102265 [Kordia periserrulae]|uniref:Uncharacterized protein n=1 Tax=Kordia periserrulae TaxID=701523 RepID=A0A2T6C3H3_9FLAO|nr:hypothetical protein C8N46_102265 [Kordia periserrulae]
MSQGVGFYVLDDIRRTKKRRNKRDAFNPDRRYYKNDRNTRTFPKISEIQLRTIRENVKKQNRQSLQKTIVIFSIVGCLLATALYYLLFVYQV